MKRISLLILILLFSCKAKNLPEKDLPKNDKTEIGKKDSVFHFFVPETKQEKIQSLKKENHLLRVEIDHLKKEVARLEKLTKVQKEIITVKKSLEAVKTEIEK